MLNKLYEISTKYIFPSDHTTATLGSIDFNVSLIQWFGIPFVGAKKESKTYKIFLIIYGIIVMTLTTFIYTGFEIYDMVLCWGNLNDLTQNTCLSLSHLAAVVKVINVFYWHKDILRIIQKLKILIKKYVISEAQQDAFYWGEFENKIPLTFYAFIVGANGIMGMALIVIDPSNFAGKRFPYRVKMPDFIPYTAQLVYMSLAVLIVAIQVVGMDYLNVTLINQVRYQMKILNIAFDRLDTDSDMDVNSYLKSLLRHHAEILRIRKEIEGIFNFPLIVQFLTSLLIFALTGFQATTAKTNSAAGLIYIYSGCIFVELFVYCWFGNEVSEQNKTLALRGYNSSWYTYDQHYKKSLLTFLINAQRPFYFTAGGFLNLSLITFSGILGKSYTYIAVLRQIYAEK